MKCPENVWFLSILYDLSNLQNSVKSSPAFQRLYISKFAGEEVGGMPQSP